ncbi:unnamed protein product [Meganyctiphanes norvegica]|uniref:Acyl-CoA oxidase C-terminal domain-containing protein n=1 Tax=Meganyctiphanes norvegica TaxID=48144 RepID=A0AAV2S931_MEGNR
MTAEGDNSVLMQKVAKERLAVFSKLPVNRDLAPDAASTEYLHDLMNRRENTLFMGLGKEMAKAGRAGMFEAWMLHESDRVQAAAKAYGERVISDQTLNVMADAEESLKPILHQLHHLYLLDIVEKNALTFITNDLITPQFAKEVLEMSREVCRSLGPHALALCDAFAISDSMLSAPIALDWVDYNVTDNQGELD